jgi:hypothetical protein
VKEVYLDLSDKIFIHKNFIEVTWKRYTNKKALLEHLEEFINEERPNIKFQVSKWNGDKLEEVLLKPIELCLLIIDKRIVRFG